MVFSYETNQTNLIDFEGLIFVIIIDGIISIKKHKAKVPMFNKLKDKKSMLTGTSET